MDGEYVLLCEKDEMWARMLVTALRAERIACEALPVNGAAYTMRTAMPETLRVYVPESELARARDVLAGMFGAEQ